ncbi:N-acetylneuraminate synthase family protein (plasmid) [Mesorhizobium sp. AR07]|uniref:N-acetylneuraminate synthase family protein n=1 Tax=Mesorhizobium sp. AR07 TaxID=2865838 RepID=UPI00215F0591|nr:N-acetylneuraminate synthase family protein [Mesorhizobium sp. AR07]UVK48509.1 N-acetylneuraminate synthase family protein [Mesorhizobium sp. AR07]
MKVIAEIGVNHDGDVNIALKMVDACKRLGADYAKFQIFDAAKLVTASARRATYQTQTVGAGSQFDMLKSLQLSYDDFRTLKAYCDEIGIAFLATPFDEDSACFLIDDLGCRTIKVGSGDMDNLPLLLLVASKGVEMIVSTGMATVDEIRRSVDAIAYGQLCYRRGSDPFASGFPTIDMITEAGRSLQEDGTLAAFLTLLHCTSEYPAHHPTLNMSAIVLLREVFHPVSIGFSDHSTDDVAAIMATTLGATVIERHITYDKLAEGPDHGASLDEREFARMMDRIKATANALGSGQKNPSDNELALRGVARKRIVAARPIRAGQILTHKDIALKRSSEGRPAGDIFDVIGRAATDDVNIDDAIST